MTLARAVPALVVLGLVAMLAAGVWLLSQTPGTLVNEPPPVLGPTPQPGAQTVFVTVEDGDTAGEIGEKLENAGVVQSGRLFRVLATLMGAGDDLVAGEYEFERGETALTAVRRISQGVTAPLVVTIPEGLRKEEIGQLLERRGVVSADEFQRALDGAYTQPFMAGLPMNAGLEGFLFPATYGFSRDATAHGVVEQLLNAFQQRFEADMQIGLAATNRSLLEVVTLASIVEREAQVPNERPIIASVFLNRLELGLPLQADPTVQYALGNNLASVLEFGYWKQELTEADLDTPSPYNTYVVVGLPPGPIANPGLDSILAALEPAHTNLLFFVACPDGSHAFAETLEEHNSNVRAVNRGECPP
jgi:UPF0755 protein